MRSLRLAMLLLWKDLALEWRSRDVLGLMFFFGTLVVLVFSFAFLSAGHTTSDVVSGILWSATLFSGTLGLERSAEHERETLRALLLTPTPPAAIFLGKVASMVIFMLAAEALVLFFGALFFGVPLVSQGGKLAALFVLGTIGFAAVGTVFAIPLSRHQSGAKDLLLMALLYPIILPIVIAGTRGTAALLDEIPDLDAVSYWLRFLAAFDVLFVVASVWVFGWVIEERT